MLVRYVGREAPHIDRLYRTSGFWREIGEVVEIPDDKARIMVSNHPDVYAMANSEPVSKEAIEDPVVREIVDRRTVDSITVTEADGSQRTLRDASLPAVKAWVDTNLGMQLPDAPRNVIADTINEALANDPTAGVTVGQKAPEPVAGPSDPGGLAALESLDDIEQAIRG